MYLIIIIISLLFLSCNNNKNKNIENGIDISILGSDTLTIEQQIEQVSKLAESLSKTKLKLTIKEFKNYIIEDGDYIEIVNDGTILDSMVINANNVTIVANNLLYADKPILQYPNKIIIDGKNKTMVGITINGTNVILINFDVSNCKQVGVRWNGWNGYAANGLIHKIGFNYYQNTDSIIFSNQSGFRIYGIGTILNNVSIDSTAFDACGIGVSGVTIKNCKFTNVALAGHSNGDGVQLYEDVVPMDAIFTMTNTYINVKNAIKHCLLGHDRKIIAINNILVGGSSGIIAGSGSIIDNNTISDQQTNLFTKTIGRGIILMSSNVYCKNNKISNDNTGILVRVGGNIPGLETDNIFNNCLYNVKYK